MPWYRSGTVAITAGQTSVVGTNTDFALNSRVGDAFQGPDGRWYEVTNIASPTVLSILPAYQGSTAATGAYGLAPMQGYVKESADRLRQLVEQFGSTLALLGNPADVAALRVNIGAASRGANSDITSIAGLTTALSIAQGGTGATTAAGVRTALGLKSAAVADILGTVSQASGVPTGAIIERGTNANGEYVRFADGTQIGVIKISAASIASNANRVVTWTYPIAFAARPSMKLTPSLDFSSFVGPVIAYQDEGTTHTATGTRVVIRNLETFAQTAGVYMVAIGRWF